MQAFLSTEETRVVASPQSNVPEPRKRFISKRSAYGIARDNHPSQHGVRVALQIHSRSFSDFRRFFDHLTPLKRINGIGK
jgi:hypothetical protein